MICYESETEKKADIDKHCAEAVKAERDACIAWLELEASHSHNPAHKRVLRGIAHDLRAGAHLKQP